jgi:hypothetical protein
MKEFHCLNVIGMKVEDEVDAGQLTAGPRED